MSSTAFITGTSEPTCVSSSMFKSIFNRPVSLWFWQDYSHITHVRTKDINNSTCNWVSEKCIQNNRTFIMHLTGPIWGYFQTQCQHNSTHFTPPKIKNKKLKTKEIFFFTLFLDWPIGVYVVLTMTSFIINTIYTYQVKNVHIYICENVHHSNYASLYIVLMMIIM